MLKKACDKSMLLEPILIYVGCSLCTELTGKGDCEKLVMLSEFRFFLMICEW